MRSIRYECLDEEFSGAFVEFTTSWSRRETREAWDANANELVEIFRKKIVDLYLPLVGTDPIRFPSDITQDSMESMDLRLYQWLITAWVKLMGELADLGNALGRTLYVSLDSGPSQVSSLTTENNVPSAQHLPIP